VGGFGLAPGRARFLPSLQNLFVRGLLLRRSVLRITVSQKLEYQLGERQIFLVQSIAAQCARLESDWVFKLF